MTDTLITFDTAKLAKDIEFDIECYHAFDNIGTESISPYTYKYSNIDSGTIVRPTQSLLQKWIRENYNIHIAIDRDEDMWKPEIYSLIGGNKHIPYGFKNYKTYEDALDAGLLNALKTIQKQIL